MLAIFWLDPLPQVAERGAIDDVASLGAGDGQRVVERKCRVGFSEDVRRAVGENPTARDENERGSEILSTISFGTPRKAAEGRALSLDLLNRQGFARSPGAILVLTEHKRTTASPVTHGKDVQMRKRVAMILANNFEDAEAIEPLTYLRERGVEVTIIGLNDQAISGKKGAKLKPDATLAALEEEGPEIFDMLVIPGGGSPENLRINDAAVEFTRRFVVSGKPVGSICHGPQLLITANLLAGRTTTCVNKIRDDVMNAGAAYQDLPVVIDGNLISSRIPADLDAFHRALAEAIGVASD